MAASDADRCPHGRGHDRHLGVKVGDQPVRDIQPGTVVVFEGELWKVEEVRRTAMTSETNEVWLILDTYKQRNLDSPLIDQDTILHTIRIAS
jgi:asparagine synthetase B (glutamine-hydrolysing)